MCSLTRPAPGGHPCARAESHPACAWHGHAIRVLQQPAVQRKRHLPPLCIYSHARGGTGRAAEGQRTAEKLSVQRKTRDSPTLVSPHLGDRVPTSWTIGAAVSSAQQSDAKPPTNAIVALPLGGRIKVDPWSDQLRMARSKPEAALSEAEKMPFQITPFVFYLTRQVDNSATQPADGVAAKLDDNAKP